MESDTVLRIIREALLLVLILSGPAIIVAMAVGLLISLFQAATQLQEQTLTVVPKIVAVFAVIGATGLWMTAQVVRFGVAIFELIARI